MTAPVWMASPPEVHSALLSSGPGPGSLLAAAGGWSSLSEVYAATAEELSAILASVQAGSWEGPTAAQYVAAHMAYLAWLTQASVDSAGVAVQQETAAAAYSVALAAMPTLVELAVNHAIHAVLVATNFFGLNTIPIALNEADYVRMWIQAATTMATYQAVSGSAVASAPRTKPAPQIGNANSGGSSDSGVQDIVDNDAGDPYQLSWWENRFLELSQTLQRDVLEFPQDPSGTITQLESDIPGLVADEAGHAAEAYNAFAPEIQALALTVSLANVGFAGGFAGLSGLSGLTGTEPEAVPVATAPMPNTPNTPSVPVANSSPVVSTAPTPGPAPSSAPASAPAAAPAAAPAGAPPPPPAGIEGAAYPYLVSGPVIGARTGISSSARRKVPEPDIAAVPAAASAQEKGRARRRRRARMNDHHRGHRYEFLDSDANELSTEPEVLPTSALASDLGAGPLGFAGTTRKDVVEAAGLVTLSGDGFGGGPSVPMVPGTWEPDQPKPDQPDL